MSIDSTRQPQWLQMLTQLHADHVIISDIKFGIFAARPENLGNNRTAHAQEIEKQELKVNALLNY